MEMHTYVSIVILVSLAIYILWGIRDSRNYERISIQLDEMYRNINEMTNATIEELNRQGRKCSVIKRGKGYPKLLIDGKEFEMTSVMDSIGWIGFCAPVQIIRLKRHR